ncbi:MAG: hypothetical protein IJH04_01785 [Eggerthellaceae bacterium]|nr:hypothetical protein [Eggerthellaceae bacterium]
MLAALFAMALVGLPGCKPTDFFTEVVISPVADKVDWNNPVWTIVNSPDAEEESNDLAALDWSDDAAQVAEIQKLVTWSDEPNSMLTTHRSHFDLNPRFPGARSSEPVQLFFAEHSTIEQESVPEAAPPEEPTPEVAQSQGEEQAGVQEPAPQAQASERGDTAQDGASAGQAADSSQTDEPEPEQPAAERTDTDQGAANRQGGGYDGTVDIYDPNNAFSEPQHANHVAACGQAAVMVQALGGKGALVAMDQDTYLGTGATTVSNFATVFADELPSNFAQTAILWSGDGGKSSDLRDADALVKACGQGGVILFDQAEGNAEGRFDLETRKKLQAAGIQLIPLDFSTVQGMLDAAQVIGDVLSGSTECALDASRMAADYQADVSSLVKAAAQSHGGTLGVRDESAGGSRVLTTYNANPVTALSAEHLYVAIGTDYVQGVSYGNNGSYLLDTTGGLLFERLGQETPLSFWAQVVGAWDRAADVAVDEHDVYAMLWAVEGGAHYDRAFFSGGSGAVALSRCVTALVLASGDTVSNSTRESYLGNGLGSSEFPYLIVCASGKLSASQVKASLLKQMNSTSPITAYSILPFNGQSPALKDANGNWIYSAIGSTAELSAGNVFIEGKVSAAETVRENPAGLLGSWTGCSMESVLEAVWLARIYSAAPANNPYDASSHAFTKEQLRDAVTGFYAKYYYHGRSFDESSTYQAVVTDEGL